MNYYRTGWDLDVPVCPCDVHFTDFLAEKKITNASIFHFGTGTHHHVGITCAENGSNNAVLGITASVEEIDAYTKLAIARPTISRLYKAFFGDIYLLERRLLPEFDVAFLPHVSEFWKPKDEKYGNMSDREVVDLMTELTRPGGYLLFYTGSMAWNYAGPLVEQWSKERPVKSEGEYKTLAVYRKQ
jgi:hypothetical protein